MRQFRLVHIGVAAALAGAMVTGVGLVRSVGAAGNGTASVLVPIVPCRLFDTRAAAESNVGTRNTPLGAGESATFAVWGTNGNCTIPAGATGIATNATAVNPTAASFITIYPADADPRPTASNLNVTAGGAPTPNQVTVGLSATGAISAFNNGGTVDLVLDIVGYYEAAGSGGVVDNDERYYTKTEVDASLADVAASVADVDAELATKQTTPTGTRRLRITGVGFVPQNTAQAMVLDFAGIVIVTAGACAFHQLDLPDGAVVTKLSADLKDNSATNSAVIELLYSTASTSFNKMASLFTGTPATAPGAIPKSTSEITSPTIVNDDRLYFFRVCGGGSTGMDSGTLEYTLP